MTGEIHWAPEFLPIWKHHYTSHVFQDVQRQVLSLKIQEGDVMVTNATHRMSYRKSQTGVIQMRKQWPGLADGSLERTIRELVPGLKQETRVVFMNPLAGQGDCVAIQEVRMRRSIAFDQSTSSE